MMGNEAFRVHTFNQQKSISAMAAKIPNKVKQKNLNINFGGLPNSSPVPVGSLKMLRKSRLVMPHEKLYPEIPASV